MRISVVLLASIVAAGCGGASPNEPPPMLAGSAAMQHADASNVLVLQTTKLGRYAEVVGVVDVHESMGDERVALQTLRE
jgi:hypothetical protein